MKTLTYKNPSIGCYLDHGNRSNDELSIDIIDLAAGYGRETPADIQALLEREGDGDELPADDCEALHEDSEDAINWLNDQEIRSFLYWANDGEANAFGLWPSVESAREDCGFVSGGEDADPDDSDYPAADYRGEWLHVNDHGNATLYVREDFPGRAFHDREVWAVV